MLNNIFDSLLSGLYSVFYRIVLVIPIYFISLSVHEYAHGFIAYKLGDPTAKDAGRLTLNPLRHIDPVGMLMMLLFGFGWAKPVPINPSYNEKPRRAMMLTALAGPVSNFILAFLSSFFYVFSEIMVLTAVYHHSSAFITGFTFVSDLFGLMTQVNLILALFNLIPVHPLDGSRILNYFLPRSFVLFMRKYSNYICVAFFVLLLTTDIAGIIISPILDWCFDMLCIIWHYPAWGLVDLLFKIFI